MLNFVKIKIGNEKSQDVQRGLKSQMFFFNCGTNRIKNQHACNKRDGIFSCIQAYVSFIQHDFFFEIICNPESFFQCFDTKISFKDQELI